MQNESRLNGFERETRGATDRRSSVRAARDEAVTDVDHRLDADAVRREASAQAVDVDVEAHRVERRAVAPGVTANQAEATPASVDVALRASRERMRNSLRGRRS